MASSVSPSNNCGWKPKLIVLTGVPKSLREVRIRVLLPRNIASNLLKVKVVADYYGVGGTEEQLTSSTGEVIFVFKDQESERRFLEAEVDKDGGFQIGPYRTFLLRHELNNLAREMSYVLKEIDNLSAIPSVQEGGQQQLQDAEVFQQDVYRMPHHDGNSGYYYYETNGIVFGHDESAAAGAQNSYPGYGFLAPQQHVSFLDQSYSTTDATGGAVGGDGGAGGLLVAGDPAVQVESSSGAGYDMNYGNSSSDHWFGSPMSIGRFPPPPYYNYYRAHFNRFVGERPDHDKLHIIYVSRCLYPQDATVLREVFEKEFGEVSFVRVFQQTIQLSREQRGGYQMRQSFVVPQGAACVRFKTLEGQKSCLQRKELFHPRQLLDNCRQPSKMSFRIVGFQLALLMEAEFKAEEEAMRVISTRKDYQEMLRKRDFEVTESHNDLMVNRRNYLEFQRLQGHYDVNFIRAHQMDYQASWIHQILTEHGQNQHEQ